MSIDQDVMDAIDKNLSKEIGTRLAARLITADSDAQKVATLQAVSASLTRELDNLKGRVKTEEALHAREQTLNKRDVDLTIREKLIELREKHAMDRVNDLRGVVKDVFSNNRFKYSTAESNTVPVPTGTGSYMSASGGASRTVEGEG